MRQPINSRDYQGSEAIDPYEGPALNGRLGSFQLIWLKLEKLKLCGFSSSPCPQISNVNCYAGEEIDEELEEEEEREALSQKYRSKGRLFTPQSYIGMKRHDS